MKIQHCAFILLMLASCKTGSADKKTAIDELNARSKACIRIMNESEEKKNAAIAANDGITVTAMQQRIDSAAMANVKIGQEISELQAKQ